MRQLWTEDHVSYQGEYYQTRRDGVRQADRADALYVAGAGASAAKLAGRVADGFICTSGKAWDLYTETPLRAGEGPSRPGATTTASRR